MNFERIAVMYQDDSFGRAGYRGVRLALERRGMEPAAVGLYARNTTSVKTGVLDLLRADPQAVILVGAYEPVAHSIAWAKRLGMDAVFMTVSFVGSNALAEELGPHRRRRFRHPSGAVPNRRIAAHNRAILERPVGPYPRCSPLVSCRLRAIWPGAWPWLDSKCAGVRRLESVFLTVC